MDPLSTCYALLGTFISMVVGAVLIYASERRLGDAPRP